MMVAIHAIATAPHLVLPIFKRLYDMTPEDILQEEMWYFTVLLEDIFRDTSSPLTAHMANWQHPVSLDALYIGRHLRMLQYLAIPDRKDRRNYKGIQEPWETVVEAGGKKEVRLGGASLPRNEAVKVLDAMAGKGDGSYIVVDLDDESVQDILYSSRNSP